YAFDTQDRTPSSAFPIDIKAINGQIAAMLGTMPEEILINGIAVNPISKNIYMSISRGRGPSAVPAIFRVSAKGKLDQFSVDNVKHAKVDLVDGPESKSRDRRDAITDLGYVDGTVIVAGLSNEEFASALRVFPFPFAQGTKGTSIEMWHSDHGRFETQAPIRT